MSQLLVNDYIRDIEELKRFGGSKGEGAIRQAFIKFVNGVCRPRNLRLIENLEYVTKAGKIVYPDGTVKDALRLAHGYWEAKDEYDDLDEEIRKKLAKGYPTDNIIFEDSKTAVLIQNGVEVIRVRMREASEVKALAKLVTTFVDFEQPEIHEFHKAIEHFKDDLPDVLGALREMFETQRGINKNFKTALDGFLKLCQDSIHKDVTLDDMREMLIQHILTEEIFLEVFSENQFHRENNIAHELQRVADTFFTGAVKKDTLKRLESYYGAIRKAATDIADHHEKQTFLKVVYENFYKVYSPKLADRLGVIYTPIEIVRFMIESSEALIHRHFGKLLQDKDVEIMDPATGTGTFITDLIEHMKGNKSQLRYKYLNELHCNEVAILPYYIANLNIEYTYQQVTGKYEQFPHICFVDTLDNLGFDQFHQGSQGGLDFGLSAENLSRIGEQNKRKISVIIGNPPYNANQMNENDVNKNREYPGVDKRIKETYIAESAAQKTKLYDMYARFIRWASDRVSQNGVVAFITNRSFIDSRTFDGFRKTVGEEFKEIWILDLGGDVRANPRLSGTTHNVFGIQTGVAISFLVKKQGGTGCKIYYSRRPELETADDKLSFLASTKLDTIEFTHITPDKNHNWINLSDNDFDSLIAVASKETKLAKAQAGERAIFKLVSNGIVTARDEWTYDFNKSAVAKKVEYFCRIFRSEQARWIKAGRPTPISDFVSREIKWTTELEAHLERGTELIFDSANLVRSLYRPFVAEWTYYAEAITHRRYQMPSIFPDAQSENVVITFVHGNRLKFAALATNLLPNYAIFSLDPAQGVPLYRYDSSGNRVDNITDWGLQLFRERYAKTKKTINKLDIFHYVYGVLNDPVYYEKYALNLKREFPRVPFYPDFWQWAAWGEELMDLHIGYESAKPYKLKRTDDKDVKNPKVKLKADKEAGKIILDEKTMLSGVPPEAWDYKLGNRSALEWIPDQYKESVPKDPTIREKFNTYHFADYKEHVIDLLCRVCTVSVETQKITAAMKGAKRHATE